ncbi:MAG: SLC26A/SulP transporter family protein [Elusimicrobia bacterium]|nr:SLC26A/SulP transporter family protein [Elusimicrobiota bacterium]
MPEGPRAADDVLGGATASLVALPSAIAFGVAALAPLGPDHAGTGALLGLTGAAAIGLVAPLAGRTAALISAPCAPAAAVLAALCAKLSGLGPERVLSLLAATALFSALLQIAYGAVGGGRLIKYIPYPVVSGYLSGVGLIIALGQLPRLLGLPAGAHLADAGPASWSLPSLAVGAAAAGAMAFSSRLTGRVPGAVLGLAAGAAVYAALAAALPALRAAAGNPLVIGPLPVAGGWLAAVAGRASALASLSPADLRLVWGPALTLSALLSIDTLKTCVLLDALTQGRHHSDRELRGQGLANLASLLAGGMPGAGTSGPTLVNVAAGGRSWRSGAAEGAAVLLICLLLTPLVAWVPIAALAGILLVVAFRLVDWHAFDLLRHPETRLDFAVIAAVVAVAEGVGLIAASAVGVALAILLFIRDQVRVTVVHRKLALNEAGSKTRRLPEQKEVLLRDGGRGAVVELRGSLFFGTTDQLFTELEPDLAARRWLLFDLRRVHSLDYTAAHLFGQMHARLAAKGGGLLFSGLPSSLPTHQDIEGYLDQVGLTRAGGIRIFETKDEALEWMEEGLLDAAGVAERHDRPPLEARELALFRELPEASMARLEEALERRSLAHGERLFSRGDEGDTLFLVRKGAIRVLLPLPGGKKHHVATFGRGDFLGELAFLDRERRSADAEAKRQTELYVLSRAKLNALSRADPPLGTMVFARLALAVSQRLRVTDAELSTAEDR